MGKKKKKKKKKWAKGVKTNGEKKKKGTVSDRATLMAQHMARPWLAKEALTRCHCGLLMAQTPARDGARLDGCSLNSHGSTLIALWRLNGDDISGFGDV